MQDAEAELDEEFYTIEELVDVLGVSTDTIRRRIRSGKIHAIKRIDENIPGHQERWVIPKRTLGVQEVTEVLQVPRTLSLSDFDEMLTSKLQDVLNERDQQFITLLRSEISATIAHVLDEQLRTTNRRIEGLDRTLRALPAPVESEKITELESQVKDLKADFASIKDSISNIAENAQSAANDVKMLLPAENTEKDKEEMKLSRWQRFKNRWSRKQSEET